MVNNFFKIFKIQNVILFESNSDYCDNSRAISDYLILNNYNKKYKIVWLVTEPKNFSHIKNIKFIKIPTKDIFLETYNNLIYYYYLSISRFAFFSHRTPIFKYERGEKYINLWHGTPIKRIDFCNLGANFDYVLYGSDLIKDYYIKYLNCKEKQLIPYGNPRNDFFKKGKVELNKIFSLKEQDKIIIWMPTIRIHKNGFNYFKTNFDNELGLPIIKNLDELKKIDMFLKERNIKLLIKLHPASLITENIKSYFLNIKILENKDLDKLNINLYSLVSECNALLTDYSSIYVDFLLLDKPIGFTVNDMNSYKQGFVIKNTFEIMPGRKIRNNQDLLYFFEEIFLNKDEYSGKRKHVNKLLNKYEENFSEKIINFLEL